MTMRLSMSSFAGTARTVVAVGTSRLDSMLVTTRALAPRMGVVLASLSGPAALGAAASRGLGVVDAVGSDRVGAASFAAGAVAAGAVAAGAAAGAGDGAAGRAAGAGAGAWAGAFAGAWVPEPLPAEPLAASAVRRAEAAEAASRPRAPSPGV